MVANRRGRQFGDETQASRGQVRLYGASAFQRDCVCTKCVDERYEKREAAAKAASAQAAKVRKAVTMTEEVRAAKAATKAAARAAARAEGSKVVRKAESRAKMAVARGAFARPAAAQAFDERDWFCQPLDEAMSFYSTFLDDISSDVLTPDGAISFDQDACSFSMESIRAHNSEPCHDLDAEVDVETRSILVQPSESRTEEDGGEGKGKVHFGGQGGTTLSQSRHWFARSGAGRMAVVAKALERGRGCVSALSRISKLVRKR